MKLRGVGAIPHWLIWRPPALFLLLGLGCLLLAARSSLLRVAESAPPNDSFANAVLVSTPATSGLVATGNNTGAGVEAGEPTALTCSTGSPTTGATIWYDWTSPAGTGTAVFDTYGSSYDTVVGIYNRSAAT